MTAKWFLPILSPDGCHIWRILSGSKMWMDASRISWKSWTLFGVRSRWSLYTGRPFQYAPTSILELILILHLSMTSHNRRHILRTGDDKIQFNGNSRSQTKLTLVVLWICTPLKLIKSNLVYCLCFWLLKVHISSPPPPDVSIIWWTKFFQEGLGNVAWKSWWS